MQNAKGENLCELCFSPSESVICPNCSRAKRSMYYGSIPHGSLLAGRYVSGMLINRNNISTDYLCYDTKNDVRVVVTEYFPLLWAHRDSGSVAVSVHCNDTDKFYADGLNCFRAESEALIGLGNNRFLAEVIMSFREHNTAYRVTKYYGTRTLEKYMLQTKDKLTQELAVTAACQAAFGLQAIHAAGLIHGDICPQNIIICNDGTVKLKGVSGICRSYSAKTGSFGDIIHPGYASAELYKKAAVANAESDYYALGALIYYMLTANELTDGVSRLEGGGTDVSVADVSAPVLLIIGRLLSVNPRDRESGFYELLNIAQDYGVAAPQVPVSRVNPDYEPEKVQTPQTEAPAYSQNAERQEKYESSSFTESLPVIPEDENKEKKKKPSGKKAVSAVIVILLVFAAAAAGITTAYMKHHNIVPAWKKTTDPITSATDEPSEAVSTEKTTRLTQPTTVSQTTEESAPETAATLPATEPATESSTQAPTTATVPVTTRSAYTPTDVYVTGKYYVKESVRIRETPDTVADNVIRLVDSGVTVEVLSVYDLGESSGAGRYWGYVKYQGPVYYYKGYVPMSSLSPVS